MTVNGKKMVRATVKGTKNNENNHNSSSPWKAEIKTKLIIINKKNETTTKESVSRREYPSLPLVELYIFITLDV